jgi:hypothetical protein
MMTVEWTMTTTASVEVTAAPAAGARDALVSSPRYMYVLIFIYISFTLLTFIYKIDYITKQRWERIMMRHAYACSSSNTNKNRVLTNRKGGENDERKQGIVQKV